MPYKDYLYNEGLYNECLIKITPAVNLPLTMKSHAPYMP